MQLLLKLRQIYTATLGVNFENFSRWLAHRPINMHPNLCTTEIWLVHGRQTELTELKYLTKWRHNCSSNYGRFTLQRYGLILRIYLDHRRIARQICILIYARPRSDSYMAVRQSWQNWNIYQNGVTNAPQTGDDFHGYSVGKFWEFLSIIGASPDKYVS